MRILLIDPPVNCFTGLIKRGYPIGLCMLAAVAKQEKVDEVRVLDVDKSIRGIGSLNFTDQRRNMGKFLEAVNDKAHPVWQSIRDTLKSFKPDLVGITTMTIHYASSLRAAEIVKEWNEQCPVIMGGVHASIMPRGMIEWPFTDAVVKGEGENPFRAIIAKMAAGQTNFADIPGVITKESLDKINDLPFEAANLDSLPFPDRGALCNQENYSPEDMGLILTSRGCPYRCSYCSNFTRKTRFRSVQNVIEEIIQVQKTYGTLQFMFKDDSFTLKRQRVEDFCQTISERRLRLLWECTTRLDLLDDKLVSQMKKAGCNRVGVGVESGDEEILKILNKRLTKDQIRNGTDLLNKNKVFWTGYFMMGLPMEQEFQIYKTLEFMKELRPPYAALGIYKPYPGTRLFDMAEDLGLVEANVPNDHFFQTNPVDYFFKNPQHRVANIPEDRMGELVALMEQEFERSNKKITNIIKRSLARTRLYFHDYRSFFMDLIRAVKWLRS
jgi:anaerobic magnesium-protoporphyrin IX monomethyl ester cyclase